MLCENFVTFEKMNMRPISFKIPARLLHNKLQSQRMRFAFPFQAMSEKQKGLLFSKPASSCQNRIDCSVQFWPENILCLPYCPCHVYRDELHISPSSLKWWIPSFGPSDFFYWSYNIQYLRKGWGLRSRATLLEHTFVLFHTISQLSCSGSPQTYRNDSCPWISHNSQMTF